MSRRGYSVVQGEKIDPLGTGMNMKKRVYHIICYPQFVRQP
jgi:hypothetical protein